MPVDGAGQAAAPQFIGAGRGQRHHDARRRARFGPEDKEPRLALAATSPRVSPTNLEPRSKSTMLPSAPKVSVAVTQVVMPGSAELIAVSKVQSIKAPFGSMKRCVGSTRARTAGRRGRL